MFTGIVETLGTVAALVELDTTPTGGNGVSLTVTDCAVILEDVHLGDSIAVNGTCLTVTEFDANSFKVTVAPETQRRTTLGKLRAHDKVNLERALLPTTRMGGHMLQGHVDTIANISSITDDATAKVYRLLPRDPDILNYVVEKGFIGLDGASLTVTAVTSDSFEVMLIPYTQERLVMGAKNCKPGHAVNVEVDLVGKLVEKSVRAYLDDKNDSFFGRIVDRCVLREMERRDKKP